MTTAVQFSIALMGSQHRLELVLVSATLMLPRTAPNAGLSRMLDGSAVHFRGLPTFFLGCANDSSVAACIATLSPPVTTFDPNTNATNVVGSLAVTAMNAGVAARDNVDVMICGGVVGKNGAYVPIRECQSWDGHGDWKLDLPLPFLRCATSCRNIAIITQ